MGSVPPPPLRKTVRWMDGGGSGGSEVPVAAGGGEGGPKGQVTLSSQRRWGWLLQSWARWPGTGMEGPCWGGGPSGHLCKEGRGGGDRKSV